jgi:hypothetical protein
VVAVLPTPAARRVCRENTLFTRRCHFVYVVTGSFDVNHIVFESAFPIANKHRNNGNKMRRGERLHEPFSIPYEFFKKVSASCVSFNQIFSKILYIKIKTKSDNLISSHSVSRGQFPFTLNKSKLYFIFCLLYL